MTALLTAAILALGAPAAWADVARTGSPAPLARSAIATAAALPAATPLGVGLREWRVGIYRASVRSGRIKLNLTNFGEDAHDLQVLGPRGYRSAVSPEVAPFGGRESFTVNLRRVGIYKLICAIPGHAELGMRATLRVTPQPRRR